MQCTNLRPGKRTIKGTTFDYSYPCGYCMGCRLNRKRDWATRILLEKRHYPPFYTGFVTLTYTEEYLPEGNTLKKEDLQNYFKRLRKNSGEEVRYFAVGEYGEKTGRAHYHAIVFGMELNRLRQLTAKSWKLGISQVDVVRPGAANYVAGYVVKKLGGEAADEEYGERQRPFMLSSRMAPHYGIGYRAVREVYDAIMRYGLVEDFEEYETGITTKGTMRVEGKEVPIPRYVLQKLEKLAGKEKGTKETLVRAHVRRLVKQAEIGSDYYQQYEDKRHMEKTAKQEFLNRQKL